MTTPYLTPAEVAGRLDRSVVSVQRYCRAGLLPGAIQVGRSWGIPASALDRFTPPPIGNPEMGPGFWDRPRKAGKTGRWKSGQKRQKRGKTS
jgi:hypothetical protein